VDDCLESAFLGGDTERFASQDVLAVLERFGISHARRSTNSDDTEEVILIDPKKYEEVEVRELTLALMEVLPHRKLWVAPLSDIWESEPI